MPYIYTRTDIEAKLRQYIGNSFDDKSNEKYKNAAIQAAQAALNNLEGNAMNYNNHTDQGLVNAALGISSAKIVRETLYPNSNVENPINGRITNTIAIGEGLVIKYIADNIFDKLDKIGSDKKPVCKGSDSTSFNINEDYRFDDNQTRENMIDVLNNDQIHTPTPDEVKRYWEKIVDTSDDLYDPIIFDLNGDNVLETTDTTNGVYFDHDNNGFAEASAWVGENDGILVIDTNNNGEIDNGTEVLLHSTLATFDTNNDGIIDANDANFANLKILKGDGTLMTLAEAGITSITLNTTTTDITDENGNQQFASGTFTRTDGTTGTFGEFLVSTDPSNSTATEWIDETDEIENLPDIAGRGVVYSLHQAMLRDKLAA